VRPQPHQITFPVEPPRMLHKRRQAAVPDQAASCWLAVFRGSVLETARVQPAPPLRPDPAAVPRLSLTRLSCGYI
jgi:hypothetical protein